MLSFPIFASAESWFDFTQNEFYDGTGINYMPNQISRDTANLIFYGTPDGSTPPISPSGNIPLSEIKGVIVFKREYTSEDTNPNHKSQITWLYVTDKLPGQNLICSSYSTNGFTLSSSNQTYGFYRVNYSKTTRLMQNYGGSGQYPYLSNIGFRHIDIIYSDYNLEYNNEIRFKSTSNGTYYDTIETSISVDSSGINGQIKRFASSSFDSTKIYYRTVIVDSIFDPPILGYTIGKSLSAQNINPANLYEPNYINEYPQYIDYLKTFPVLSNEFSGLYNISPVRLPILNAYMQGNLQYDKSYTCLVLVNTQWVQPFTDWIVVGTQKFNYSAGNIIDLGDPETPDNETPGGIDLGADPPAHNWDIDGSDVVVPEIDFTSPEYKNPFDVSFLFYYPLNGENKPTFYLQYCLIAIAICAVAYLLFGKS